MNKESEKQHIPHWNKSIALGVNLCKYDLPIWGQKRNKQFL